MKFTFHEPGTPPVSLVETLAIPSEMYADNTSEVERRREGKAAQTVDFC